MDYKNIIDKSKKYHYILIVGKKAGVLGSSNSKKKAKEEVDNMIIKKNGKLEGKLVAKLKLLEISKKDLEDNERSKIKTIGGPIEIKIEFYRIKNNDLEKIEGYEKNNSLFLTDKFLKKKEINSDFTKYVASAAYNDKLNTELFVLNIVDKLIKIE